MPVKFGPAGIPISCEGGNLEGVQRVAELGLEAMELEFVYGVNVKTADAIKIGAQARKLNISLSFHCPYWINCAAKDKSKLETTERNILQSARAAHSAGGGVIVFHPGFYMGRTSAETYPLVKETLKKIVEKLKQEKLSKVILGLETSGKTSQFGTLEENVGLSLEIEKCAPVIDFAHIHARGNGCIKGEADYKKLFDFVEAKLGAPALRNFHSHFSEIQYSKKGEIRHIELGSNSPPFKPLARVIHENGYSGTIINESPLLEYDALKMKEIYSKFAK